MSAEPEAAISAAAAALVAALADPAGRAAGARALAEWLGGEDFLAFARDDEVGQLLPAPGFPKTLREMKRWRAFLAECAARGHAVATLPAARGGGEGGDAAGAEGERTATGLAARGGGSVFVLLGAADARARMEPLRDVFALLGAVLRAEQSAAASAARASAARAATAEAAALSGALDAARRRLQTALAEAEAAGRARDEFLAIVSHELRTPLNAMLGWTRMLRAGALGEARRKHAIEVIERNVDAQRRLVEDLLDVARIIAGKLRLELRPADPADVMLAAVENVRPTADAKGVELAARVERGGGAVLADAARLQQVAWNLIANAVKFTPRGGRVEVALAWEAGHAELSVSDNGRGIEPAFLPHVFDQFRQEDGGATRAHGGLGLGLSIVRHLADLHGGSVEASSAGVDRGARFVVRLPRAAGPEARAGAEPPPARVSELPEASAPTLLREVRVLVVDDEPDARELFAEALERCAARVSFAASADEAFDAFARDPPDVLVSDLGMPGGDGYALIRRVRALAPERGGLTPAVAVSAFARPEDRSTALGAGFDVHLGKPVEPDELVAMVAGLVANRPDLTQRSPGVARRPGES